MPNHSRDLVRVEAETAQRIAMPCRSMASSTAGSKAPATALLPSIVVPNRTPSSSQKPITSMAVQTAPLAVQGADAGDGCDDAQHAVIAAGIADGIEMGAEDERRQARRRALIAPDDIADRVHMHGHAGIAHPGHDEVAGPPMLGAQEHAGQPAGVLADRGQRIGAPADFGTHVDRVSNDLGQGDLLR